MSWLIKHLHHTFLGDSQNYQPLEISQLLLILSILQPKTVNFANGVDSDETVYHQVYSQDIHC